MKPHPISEPLPPMAPDRLRELADNIKTNGLQEPIVTFEGKILDGNNRYNACVLAEVEPEFIEYEGDNPVGYVLSRNIQRRDLSASLRAEIAAKLVTMTHGGDRTKASTEAVTQREAAKAAGVSRSSIQRAAAKIRKKSGKKGKEAASWTGDELKKDQPLYDAFKEIAAVFGNADTKAIRTGTIGLKRADVLELAKLPKDQKHLIQDLIMANHWTPKRAMAFLKEKPDDDSTVDDLKSWCLGTKNKFYSAEVGGFTVTCKSNRR
jgi:ParB-like nuclease family protein